MNIKKHTEDSAVSVLVNILAMTPEEYRDRGNGLLIRYGYFDSPFGNIFIASTPKGICYLGFADLGRDAFSELQAIFPKAFYEKNPLGMEQVIDSFFKQLKNDMVPAVVHVKGSPFQLKVWRALLKTPAGKLTTYGNIARQIDMPGASRAVGRAVGANPVSLLVPCHRVIRSSGEPGGYHWGVSRKKAIINWEASQPVKPSFRLAVI